MEIRAVNQDRMLWDKTNKLAENCSFPAVHRLSDRMRINDFADWERVIAAERMKRFSRCRNGKVFVFLFSRQNDDEKGPADLICTLLTGLSGKAGTYQNHAGLYRVMILP